MNVHETYLVVVFSFPPPHLHNYACIDVSTYVCIHYFLLLLQGRLSKGNRQIMMDDG